MKQKRCAYRTKPSAHNASGVIGVFRIVRAGVPCWVATWQDLEDGRIRRTQFSTLRWGEDGARAKAIQARAAEEKRLAAAFGEPGVAVQRCRSAKSNGWQVRWWEPTSTGLERMSLFFSVPKYGVEAEREANEFAAKLRSRLFPAD